MSDVIHLNPREVLARWKARGTPMSNQTLANWRCDSKAPGPPFVKFGSKVFYPVDKLEAWEAAQVRTTIHPRAAA